MGETIASSKRHLESLGALCGPVTPGKVNRELEKHNASKNK